MNPYVQHLKNTYDILAKHESPEDIAGFLRSYGVKGVPKKSFACAISEYMKMNGALSVFTGVNDGFYGQSIAEPENSYTVDHPLPVQRFIQNFDAGFYPDLVSGKDSHEH